MKHSFAFLFLLLLFRVSVGQENVSLKDGYTTFKYPNGTVSSEGLIKDGKPEGYWKSYYVTGVLKSEGKRSNHMLDSIWLFFDQTGDTTEKISYLYGKKNGWYYKYKNDPSEGLYVWSKELYAGDRKEGTATIYFPDGSVKQTIIYYDGKKEGLSKEFDNRGNVITLLEYHNDFLVSRERINRTDAKRLKQGPWKEFYPDGRIKVEKTYTDDLLHGYFKEYDEKGNLIMTMLYDKGAIVKSKVEDETEIEIANKYDETGKLIYSGAYRQNVPVGVHRQFGPDGKITNALVYNDNGLLVSQGIVDEAGNFNGRWKDFYADSTVQAEGQYTNNRRTGVWKFYTVQGKLEQTGSYNAGRPDGIWKWFYPDGSILREEEYFQGEREGGFTEYAENGDIITQGEYLAGEKNGPWKYKSGDFTEEGNYITGLKDGLWKSWYPNGKIMFKGNFIQGNPDGLQSYYYEDGRLKEEQNYDNGIRNKVWKKYDEEGAVILAIAYRNDVEVSINGVRIKLPESDVKLIK
jgi:antitoxin component YwqK of YwqJK toxin-antitoxin module